MQRINILKKLSELTRKDKNEKKPVPVVNNENKSLLVNEDERSQVYLIPEAKPVLTEAEIRSQIFGAAKNGDLIFIKAHINQHNKDIVEEGTGKTILHHAAKGGHTEIIAYLIELGANVNAKDSEHSSTPLHYAAENENTLPMKLLLKAGANINEENKNGITAIGVSVYLRRVAATKFLADHKANTNHRNCHGLLPLHTAIKPTVSPDDK